ncbi:MAG: hypothetical protein FWH08_07110 [Oscillospiraceae bacterium]|nr:hypothetical protein [Oscillospiraceae bacterium]
MTTIITAKMKITKENSWKLVKYLTFFKDKQQKLMIFAYGFFVFALACAGIVMNLVIGEPVIMLITGVAVLIMVLYAFFFLALMKKTAGKLCEAGEGQNDFIIGLDKNLILVKNQEGKPVAFYDWEQTGEVYIAPCAAYIFIKDGGGLIIIEYDALIDGSKEELTALLEDKIEQK